MLATLVKEYANNLRRNSSGSDDYDYQTMKSIADYLDDLIERSNDKGEQMMITAKQPITDHFAVEPVAWLTGAAFKNWMSGKDAENHVLLRRGTQTLPRVALYTHPAPTNVAGEPVASDGRLPERETWWLIEREGPVYTTSPGSMVGWSGDAWRAYRYATEREADTERLKLCDSYRDASKVIEHMFINNPRATGGPRPGAEHGLRQEQR